MPSFCLHRRQRAGVDVLILVEWWLMLVMVVIYLHDHRPQAMHMKSLRYTPAPSPDMTHLTEIDKPNGESTRILILNKKKKKHSHWHQDHFSPSTQHGLSQWLGLGGSNTITPHEPGLFGQPGEEISPDWHSREEAHRASRPPSLEPHGVLNAAQPPSGCLSSSHPSKLSIPAFLSTNNSQPIKNQTKP
jgi:hypothetical protein